jgi:hypothetical protein
VAGELEARWNKALACVAEVEGKIVAHEAAKVAPVADPASLATLAADLKTVWTAPLTDARLKKRIVRTVIHEVIADIDQEAAEIVLVVHWIDGVHSEMRLPRRRRGQRNSTSADVIDTVRQGWQQKPVRSRRFIPSRTVPGSSAAPFFPHHQHAPSPSARGRTQNTPRDRIPISNTSSPVFNYIDRWVFRCAVVMAAPCFDDDLRLGARTKPFEAQTLVAKLAVEAFRDAILPRLAGLDQRRANATAAPWTRTPARCCAETLGRHARSPSVTAPR